MKSYTQYICQQCDYHSSSFMGRCPQCGEWNSLVESIDSTVSNTKSQITNIQLDKELIRLNEVKSQNYSRINTGYEEFNRVLGGGIVPGSLVLIAGDPGIGKSTLLLETAIAVGQGSKSTTGTTSTTGLKKSSNATARDTSGTPDTHDTRVLYVTGEESAQQVKIRADRINKKFENVYILAVASVEAIVAAVEKIKPTLVIVDSIQTMTTEKLVGPAGSVGQVRETSSILQRLAKKSHVPIFLVGHVTKEGNVAGPKVLEHLVDAVLNLEGDGMHTFRLLRSIKNRFGSTMEVGVFEMTDGGMKEVANPSQIFLAEKLSGRPGSVVCSTIAGGRPLLAEVQSLVNSTVFGMPARKITGLDFGRMQIVIASLGRSAKIATGTLDIYVNVAGGLKIEEPAADLAAALAIASAVSNKPVPEKLCAFGEVGLLGELRMVGNIKSRISEAKRLGFTDFVSPEKFKTLEEAVRYALRA